MTIKIKRSDLEKLSKDDLIAIAREAGKISEAAKFKTIDSYWETAHEKQKLFHQAAASHRIRYFLGGNRSGKSTAGFVEDILLSTGRQPYLKNWKIPCKGVVVVQDFENHAKNILEPKFNEWTPKGDIIKIDRNQIGAIRKIYFKCGSTIDVLSHDQDIKVFEGADYDFAHFDEPPPRKIFTAVWRGLTDRGGILHVTATPLMSPWIYQEIKKSQEGDPLRWSICVKSKENAKNIGDGDESLGLKRVEEFASLLDDSEKGARLDGEVAQIKGLVFKEFSKTHHLIRSFELPAHWKIYESIDPHPHKPWAVSWIALSDNGHKILVHSKKMEGTLEEIGGQIIYERGRIPIKGGNRPKIIRCIIDNYASVPLWQKSNTDPTVDRLSVREELENYIGPVIGGPTIEVAPKNISQKIELFKGWLTISETQSGSKESVFYVFDTQENQEFIFEIENYIWDSNKSGNLKDKPRKEDDDILDTVMQVALCVPKDQSNESYSRPVRIMEQKTWTMRR